MTFGTEFWSAICGAVVGGLIAFLIQIITLCAARNERISRKKERREALGHSIMFKALRINGNLYGLHLHLEKGFSAVDPDLHSEPWRFILALAASPADVYFSTDEMSFILSLKDIKLFDKFISLDVRHNDLNSTFKTYSDLRNDMQAGMSAKMEGNIGTTSLSEEELLILGPKMVVMNNLIAEVRIRVKNDYEESKEAMKDFNKALNEQLGMELKVEFKTEEIAALAEVTKQR